MNSYVIWSFKHTMWWGPDRGGYTPHLEQAGRYGAVDAGDIVTNDVMLDNVAVHLTIAEPHGPPTFHPYNGTNYQDSTEPCPVCERYDMPEGEIIS